MLYLEIQDGLHRGGTGVTEDRARSQGARAELHAPLEPADRLAVHESADRGGDQPRVVGDGEGGAECRQPLFDIFLGKRGTEVGALHGVKVAPKSARLRREEVVTAEGGTQGAA